MQIVYGGSVRQRDSSSRTIISRLTDPDRKHDLQKWDYDEITETDFYFIGGLMPIKLKEWRSCRSN